MPLLTSAPEHLRMHRVAATFRGVHKLPSPPPPPPLFGSEVSNRMPISLSLSIDLYTQPLALLQIEIYGKPYVRRIYIYIYIYRRGRSETCQCGARSGSPQLDTVIGRLRYCAIEEGAGSASLCTEGSRCVYTHVVWSRAGAVMIHQCTR